MPQTGFESTTSRQRALVHSTIEVGLPYGHTGSGFGRTFTLANMIGNASTNSTKKINVCGYIVNDVYSNVRTCSDVTTHTYIVLFVQRLSTVFASVKFRPEPDLVWP